MYYTYLVWNKETKMKYIGYHKHNNDIDSYYGSPCAKANKNNLEFQRLLKENRTVLKKRILKWFNDETSAIEHEIYLHHKYSVDVNPMFYNAAKQTAVKFKFSSNHTEESKKRMSYSQKSIGNKPPHPNEWWTKMHSKAASERSKGANNGMSKAIVIDGIEYKYIQEAVDKLNISREKIYYKIRNEENSYFVDEKNAVPKSYALDRPGKAKGSKNAMASKKNRDKVAKSKIGLKALWKNGKRKMAKPNSEKWKELIVDGYKPVDFFIG